MTNFIYDSPLGKLMARLDVDTISAKNKNFDKGSIPSSIAFINSCREMTLYSYDLEIEINRKTYKGIKVVMSEFGGDIRVSFQPMSYGQCFTDSAMDKLQLSKNAFVAWYKENLIPMRAHWKECYLTSVREAMEEQAAFAKGVLDYLNIKERLSFS